MSAGDEVLAAWAAAGTDTVTLPTGTEVQLMLPGPGALARRGMTPGVLRGIVSRLSGDVARAGMTDQDWATWEAEIRELIADAVVAIRPPGRDDFTEHRITPEAKIPPVDEDSLVAMVLRFESPAQVTVRSRAVLAGQPARGAAAAWARTAHATLPAWEAFVDSDEGYLCAISARTWGTRPSELLGIGDPVVGYAVDEALAIRLVLGKDSARKDRQPLPAEAYEQVGRIPHDPAIAEEVAAWHVQLLRAEGRLTEPMH